MQVKKMLNYCGNSIYFYNIYLILQTEMTMTAHTTFVYHIPYITYISERIVKT